MHVNQTEPGNSSRLPVFGYSFAFLINLMCFALLCLYVVLQGPPGTGKTTSILAVARQLLGSSLKDAVLELNASDDRSATAMIGGAAAFCSQHDAMWLHKV
jgi:DNA polymerase III delta prime subunit